MAILFNLSNATLRYACILILYEMILFQIYITCIYITSALQIRAGQWTITANLWPLTTHIYHVMIIVTSGFSMKPFYYHCFHFAEILLNDFELVFLELLNIRNSFF